MPKCPKSLLQQRSNGRCAHHIEADVYQPAMKDAACEDAIILVIVKHIPRTKGEVLEVEVENGLQEEYSNAKSNNESIRQRD